jgi:hypothetical protein
MAVAKSRPILFVILASNAMELSRPSRFSEAGVVECFWRLDVGGRPVYECCANVLGDQAKRCRVWVDMLWC